MPACPRDVITYGTDGSTSAPIADSPANASQPMKATPKALFNESGPWEVLPGGPADQFAKLRACRAYKSQIEPLGGLRVLMAVLRYEAQRGGESISWIDDS